jgi:predicted membrane GTPase involved in stress response
MRASGSDEKMKIAPPLKHTLGRSAWNTFNQMNMLKVTPKSIRLRKIYLERKRS